jgi:8-oxo-dGTP diphosphatase
MPRPPRTIEEVDWESWSPTERAVLCFVLWDGQALLIHKKTGLGSGKVNGPGGRIEPGELPAEAAIRETVEETGIRPADLREAASLSFVFTDGYSLSCEVFFAASWNGTLVETREAAPFWCRIDAIPYDRMWADDALWLPRALRGERVAGRFVFDGDAMLSHHITSHGPQP